MHFTMFYRTKQEWNPMISHCQTKFLVSKAEYNSVYLTTEITDLAAFVLSAYRLRNLNGLGLTRLLMRQGLGYFLVAL